MTLLHALIVHQEFLLCESITCPSPTQESSTGQDDTLHVGTHDRGITS